MESLVYHRKTCRLCDSPDVDRVLKLTPCPPVDAFVPESLRDQKQEVFPMDLYLCRTCGHAQLLDVVSPKLLFGSYIYTTSSSPGLVEYFKTYASRVCDQLSLTPGGTVLDIGSNDGTLLSFFKSHGLRVLGVDPAREIAGTATAAGIETLPEFFDSEIAKRVRSDRGLFNLITANNVFAHSDALGDMAEGVCSLLKPDGVFVFEVSYLLDMVENMVFDFIYHEHLSHHSIKPLQTFMRRHGLDLFSVERTQSKGGTIRCFAQRVGGPRSVSPTVSQLLKLEEDFGLYRLDTYRAYTAKIEEVKRQLQELLKGLRSQGCTVAGYGASATGTVLTYHFELGDQMLFIVDDNPVRQSRFSPGHHIPILSSRALMERRPDYVIILAWRFADMIIAKNEAYQRQGGRFIVPLPTLKVV
ncbi:MAG: class I SAM-dependent methyltransferase [Pedosphaera sp.]|nr:class I SAM-dependent methyltransferase [Pedosphaera sp.]